MEDVKLLTMKLLPGFQRLAIGAVVVWFVFWTCAYIIAPHQSETEQLAGYVFSFTQLAVGALLLLTAAFFGAPWIVRGFRSKY